MVFFQLNVTGLLFQSFRTASPNYDIVINYNMFFTNNMHCKPHLTLFAKMLKVSYSIASIKPLHQMTNRCIYFVRKNYT